MQFCRRGDWRAHTEHRKYVAAAEKEFAIYTRGCRWQPDATLRGLSVVAKIQRRRSAPVSDIYLSRNWIVPRAAVITSQGIGTARTLNCISHIVYLLLLLCFLLWIWLLCRNCGIYWYGIWNNNKTYRYLWQFNTYYAPMMYFIYETQVRRLAFYIANTVFSSRQTPAILAFLGAYQLFFIVCNFELRSKSKVIPNFRFFKNILLTIQPTNGANIGHTLVAFWRKFHLKSPSFKFFLFISWEILFSNSQLQI